MRAAAPLLARETQILRPTLFPPGFVEPAEFASIEDLEARLRTLAGDRPLTYRGGSAAYPGFDVFHSITAYAGGDYLATFADRWETWADCVVTLGELRARA